MNQTHWAEFTLLINLGTASSKSERKNEATSATQQSYQTSSRKAPLIPPRLCLSLSVSPHFSAAPALPPVFLRSRSVVSLTFAAYLSSFMMFDRQLGTQPVLLQRAGGLFSKISLKMEPKKG